MSIIKSYMVPHPPLIIPDIGKGNERDIQKTIDSYEQIAKEIAKLKPETIIISTPHTTLYSDYFHITPGKVVTGDLSQFRASNIKFEEQLDEELINEIDSICKKNKFPGGKTESIPLDHGAMIPLYFIKKYYTDFKLVVIGLSGLPLIDNYQMGMFIKEAVNNQNKKVVYIASGDLSHKLQTYGPYGFAKEGPEYDKKIMEVCSNANFKELLYFEETFLDKAAECGHRSFTIMAGAFDGLNVEAKELSHEDITGVGYGICTFTPKEKNESRKLLYDYLNNQKKLIDLKKQKEDCYIKLARQTIEEYIRTGNTPKLTNNIDNELLNNKSGVFVSIHKFGSLRGCIGTILPIHNCIAEEIIQNAISASSKDDRFPPITKEELDYLDIKVDVIKEPELILSKEELDVKKYGVIVSSGYKRGLLLPDLDGVDTIDQQISIAMKKGNITNNETITLERFEVIRHS